MMTNRVYKDPQGNLCVLSDIGLTWASEETLVNMGWVEVSPDYQKPANLMPLKDAQDIAWASMKSTRDGKERQGFPYLGKRLDSDLTSAQRITIAVQAAQAAIAAGADKEFVLSWTCSDNTAISMTALQVLGMSVALAQYSNQLHETARTLRTQIYAATTVGDVQKVVWPAETP